MGNQVTHLFDFVLTQTQLPNFTPMITFGNSFHRRCRRLAKRRERLVWTDLAFLRLVSFKRERKKDTPSSVSSPDGLL